MSALRPAILDFPFFTLEYREGAFARLIPPDARDLGGGLFRQGRKTWKLDPGENTPALAEPLIQGRPLLALLKRGPVSLIKAGPRLAAEGERLMELSLAAAAVEDGPGAGPLIMELRTAGSSAEWLPLSGLPHHRLYQNVIYEIIDDETLGELAGFGGNNRYALRGLDIPRFVDIHGRLIFRFGVERLKTLLAEDSVFVNREALSLVLGAAPENQARRERARPGPRPGPRAVPLLRCAERRYPAEEVSRRMDQEYLLLGSRWVRREDIMAAGLLPLGCYSGGWAIETVKLKPGELIHRGGGGLSGEPFAGLFGGLEADTGLWLERGNRESIFHAHLEFLRAWGLSGGVLTGGHREQAALLVSWLIGLAVSGTDRILVLVEQRYYELYLPSLLPELKNAGVVLPGADRKNGAPVRIVFYEELPLSPMEWRDAGNIVALVEPEEALPCGQTAAHLRNAHSRITLGIFSGTGGLFRGHCATAARSLFGVTQAELLPWLIRDTAKTLSLPQFDFPPRRIIHSPPRAAGQKPFTCTVEEKFAALSGPSVYSELALFSAGGPAAPYIPLRLLKGSLDIERMEAEERAFFIYWRGEFRRRNIIKTGEAYIRVYARELCLFTAGKEIFTAGKEIFTNGKEGPSGNFYELLRLWESYQDVFESINAFLPRWLIDFALVYEMTDEVFPELIRYAKQWKDPLLSDWYLYERFINGNNSVDFGDIALLIPTIISDSVFFSGEDASGGQRPDERRRLVRDVETAVNAADRFLRENFRLRLFDFFYPPVYHREKRDAFPGMERAGRSSCVVEGVRFTQHPPLLDFLKNIFYYTEYCFRLKNGFEGGNREPPLGEAWKRAAAEALGLEDRALIPSRSAPPFSAPGRGIALRESRLTKLRADSDVVRELLKIEDESGGRETPERETFRVMARNTPGSGSLENFITGLDPAGREALKRLAGNPADPRSELEASAREHRVMPELLVDQINAAFLEQCGDLLIDTVDEQPLVQPEYIEQLRKLLGET